VSQHGIAHWFAPFKAVTKHQTTDPDRAAGAGEQPTRCPPGWRGVRRPRSQRPARGMTPGLGPRLTPKSSASSPLGERVDGNRHPVRGGAASDHHIRATA